MFARLALAAINHVLAQNSWATRRLSPLAGKTARVDIAPFSVSCTIGTDGLLYHSETSDVPHVIITIPPSLLPRLAAKDEKAYSQIAGEGESELLAEILFLSRNLEWDMAEDLSRFTGDIAAERITQGIHEVRNQLVGTLDNLAQAVSEYWIEERPVVAKPNQVNEFVRQVDVLRDDLTRLDQRVRKLSGQR